MLQPGCISPKAIDLISCIFAGDNWCKMPYNQYNLFSLDNGKIGKKETQINEILETCCNEKKKDMRF